MNCPICNSTIDLNDPVNQSPPAHDGSIFYCGGGGGCSSVLVYESSTLRNLTLEEYNALPAGTITALETLNSA